MILVFFMGTFLTFKFVKYMEKTESLDFYSESHRLAYLDIFDSLRADNCSFGRKIFIPGASFTGNKVWYASTILQAIRYK